MIPDDRPPQPSPKPTGDPKALHSFDSLVESVVAAAAQGASYDDEDFASLLRENALPSEPRHVQQLRESVRLRLGDTARPEAQDLADRARAKAMHAMDVFAVEYQVRVIDSKGIGELSDAVDLLLAALAILGVRAK